MMKQKNIVGRLQMRLLGSLYLFSMLMVFACPVLAERWKVHPAMDNAPVRIVDTERYTFFQVFQKLYSTTTSTYNEPVTAALLYDKKDPDAGIVPLKERFSLNGGTIRTMEYSPDGKFLAILYMDGGLDILQDSGNVIYNDALKKCYKPGWSTANSMTINDNKIWVATPGGYLAVDALTGQTLALSDLQQEIKWIAGCGDRIIAFTSDRMYEAAGKSFPRAFSDFRELSIPSSPNNPKVLMPRKDGSFVYLADRKASGNYSLNIAYLSDGKWKHRDIADLQIPLVAGNSIISHPFEMNFVRNKEGWLLFTGGDIRYIKDVCGPESADIVVTKPTVRKDNPEAGRALSIAGSWDGSECWTYLDRGRFSEGKESEGRFIIEDAHAVRPNLPAVSQATHLAYSAGYGTLAINYGYCWNFDLLSRTLPPLLSAYKNGEWSLPNPAYNVPRSAEGDSDLASLYRNNFARFPVSNPTGITIDPVNPDYVWLGSSFSGMASLSLSDPKADPIHLGSPADPLVSYPGFKAIFEDVTVWRGYTPTSAPSFDGDGNLWVAYHYIDGAIPGDTPGRLYYWPRENRKRVLESRNVAEIEGIGFIKIPCTVQMNAMIKCLATTHPDKKNIVFMYLTPSLRYIARLNHKGTLDDQTDDEIDLIYSVEDQNGGRWAVDYCHSMVEEPSTGLVWLGDEGSLLCFDPASEVKDGVIKGKVLDVEYEGVKGNPLSFINCNGITFDDSGRLWFTTGGTGVWGISPDRKRVVAHYTTSNSRLPHDTAYGIVWNPDSRSLMISTQEGLVELWPDDSAGVVSSHVSVSPREVAPDFTGPVSLRGASPAETVEILDLSGKQVAMVRADASGNATWNLTDSKGRKVNNGFYILKGSFGSEEIVVMQ